MSPSRVKAGLRASPAAATRRTDLVVISCVGAMAFPTVVGLLHPPPAGSLLLYGLIALFDLGAVGLGLKGLASALRRQRQADRATIAGRPAHGRDRDQSD